MFLSSFVLDALLVCLRRCGFCWIYLIWFLYLIGLFVLLCCLLAIDVTYLRLCWQPVVCLEYTVSFCGFLVLLFCCGCSGGYLLVCLPRLLYLVIMIILLLAL